MNQYDALMSFVRETREQQLQFLETIKTENEALIERYHAHTVELIGRIERQTEKSTDRIRDDLTAFQKATQWELSSVRRWYANTILAVILASLFGFGGIIYSIWATARPFH